ncbi:MAG TPA: DUF6788 family protein [Blastocatellia bacterium]|nr:DUF6788 family protein [Blastocatellia bacterium]
MKESEIKAGREVVSTRRVGGGWEREEMVRCGKEGCRCARGDLHGPYRYRYWREAGRIRSKYLGKTG